jgi:hypothetical protein
LNNKTLINFIKLTDPSGEYFEELGGFFIKQTPIFQCYKILIASKPKYWFKLYEINNKTVVENKIINITINLAKPSDIKNHEIKKLNINNYNDYGFPWGHEFEQIYNILNIEHSKEESHRYYNEHKTSLLIPVIRRIVF